MFLSLIWDFVCDSICTDVARETSKAADRASGCLCVPRLSAHMATGGLVGTDELVASMHELCRMAHHGIPYASSVIRHLQTAAKLPVFAYMLKIRDGREVELLPQQISCHFGHTNKDFVAHVGAHNLKPGHKETAEHCGQWALQIVVCFPSDRTYRAVDLWKHWRRMYRVPERRIASGIVLGLLLGAPVYLASSIAADSDFAGSDLAAFVAELVCQSADGAAALSPTADDAQCVLVHVPPAYTADRWPEERDAWQKFLDSSKILEQQQQQPASSPGADGAADRTPIPHSRRSTDLHAMGVTPEGQCAIEAIARAYGRLTVGQASKPTRLGAGTGALGLETESEPDGDEGEF